MSKIALGKSGNKTVSIDLDLLLRTRALVEGNSGSGKTHTLQEIIEEIFGKVQVIVIDIEGEFAILRKAYDFILVGKGGDTPADCRSAAILAHKLLELRASVICDLYEMKSSERHRWIRLFLEALVDSPKHLWHPVVIVIDEIHVVCPEKGAGESEAKDAVISLATRGRKRGFCLIGATQRMGKLAKDVAAELLNIMVGMTFIDIDRKRAAESLGIPKSEERAFFDQVKTMDEGNFFVLGRAISKERILVKVNDVKVKKPKSDHGHAFEPPPAPSKIKALLPKLGDLPKEAETKAKTEADLRQEVKTLKAQLAKQPTEKPAVQVKETTKEIIKKVEVPAVSPKDVLRLEASMVVAVTAAGKAQDAAAHLRGFVDKLGDQLSKIQQIQRGLTVAPPRPSSTPFMRKAEPVKEKKILEAVVKTDFGPDPAGDISPKQRKILTALAEFAEIGRGSVPRTWIAARSGSSPKSSSYANNLSSLRSRGLIDYDGVGIRLTDDGMREAPLSGVLLNAEGMKESCLRLLSPRQRQIFEALHHIYPEAASREDIAIEIGCSPTSSSFANNLSSLRSAGMIESRRDGTEKLSDWVVVEKVGA